MFREQALYVTKTSGKYTVFAYIFAIKDIFDFINYKQ